VVNEFENTIANYVGAKYAVSVNSATSAIFLALLNKNITLNIPTMIPPVVLNAIITSGKITLIGLEILMFYIILKIIKL
jgi:dTDP-4-amino-4,6-dideoxygalactose transaminase